MGGNFFRSIELHRAYDKKQMDYILKHFSQYIKQSNILGQGGDASVFNYDKDHVLKVCHKDVGYFHNFGEKLTADDFATHSKKLIPFFVPVDQVLYDDNILMIYTQRKCKLINNNDVNKNILLTVFKAVKFMFENNFIASDLAPHNWGIIDGKVAIIDYHGLKKYTLDGDIMKNIRWWLRIVRNLVRYMSLVYCPHKRKDLSLLMRTNTKKSIKKIRKDSGLPREFLDLIEYMYNNENNASLTKIIEHFDNCIHVIEKL